MSEPVPDRYAEGQVWEYRHRPEDAGSLLKIQRAERGGDGSHRIYHVSVIGVALGQGQPTCIPHSPVSRETLDASVTRISDARREWPAFIPGVAKWREDQGGVFTVTIADIVDIATMAYRLRG